MLTEPEGFARVGYIHAGYNPSPALDILAQTPVLLRSPIANATAGELDWQPRPDRWSISMVLAHLADVEGTIRRRTRRHFGMAEIHTTGGVARTHGTSRTTGQHHLRTTAQRIRISRPGPHPPNHGAVSLPRLLPKHGQLSKLLSNQPVGKQIRISATRSGCSGTSSLRYGRPEYTGDPARLPYYRWPRP